MHIEILTEDASTKSLLDMLLPQLTLNSAAKTWRTIAYRGIGRIPKDLNGKGDPSKRIILDQLPRVIRGYNKTPGIDAVLIVIDSDKRICKDFLKELDNLIQSLEVKIYVKIRLAIEETEAWYFGDKAAVKKAYPRAKLDILTEYSQDSVCGTWERMADAIYPGGSHAVAKAGWQLAGQLKNEWSLKIGAVMDVKNNVSPSFNKLKDFFDRLESHRAAPPA